MKKVKYTTPACLGCGESSVVELDAYRYYQWQSGMLVQDAFPALTNDERELLITGTHAQCWIDLFGEED